MNKEKVLFYFIIFWTLIIWINSLLPGDLSSVQSGFVTNIFQDIFNFIGFYPDPLTLSSIIRTIAHGVEFMILGFLVHLYFKVNHFKVIYLITLGLGVALVDEIIQIFIPGRAFEFKDLAVDTLGYLLGLFLIYYIFKIKKTKKDRTLEEINES